MAAVLPLRAFRPVADRVVASMPRGTCRLVPAEGGLLPHRTVLGNLVHGNRIGRIIPRATAVEEIALTATGCGLDDVLDRYPHEITAGRRRVAGLARALCGLPAVTTVVLEDAPDMPTWPNLLEAVHAPELYSVALLLLTHDAERAAGFETAGADDPDAAEATGSPSRRRDPDG
jgi:ABC-type nitrate/sulfonate/bicarbonate transport system ATPase subunit